MATLNVYTNTNRYYVLTFYGDSIIYVFLTLSFVSFNAFPMQKILDAKIPSGFLGADHMQNLKSVLVLQS